jgi:hypothetical protein
MAIAAFRVPHPRPQKLSDPHYDFSDDYLAKLLAVPDDQLEWHHYQDLLGPYLPAGTYEESVYFLPGALRCLLSHKPDLPMELVSPVMGFISKNADQLRKDGLLDAARDCIRECLAYWTRNFRVIHQGAGYKRYFDSVENYEQVAQAVVDLVDFETNADIAEAFIHDIAYATDTPIKSAWFLEYSLSQGVRHYPACSAVITQLTNDEELLLRAALIAHEHLVPTEPSPTYWHDIFKKLGLD